MRAGKLLNFVGVGDRLHRLPLVVLYLTDGCNSRCVTCDIWRNPRRNMSAALVDQIAEETARLGLRWVLLSGGEAMQHPEWPQIAGRFRAAGIYTILLTNGLLVKKQAADVIANVDELIVSLDGGTAATYAAIRGVDAFDLLLEGISEVRAGGTPVSTRTTLQRANYAEMPQIISAAKTAGVNRISFLTVDVSNPFAFGARFTADQNLTLTAGNGYGSDPAHSLPAEALTPDDIRAYRELLDQLAHDNAADFESGLISESLAKLRGYADYFGAVIGENKFDPPRCNAPHISTVIEVDGTLRPCYFLPSFGKLQAENGLTEALNNQAALALRRAYRQGERAECERCVCPLYKSPRALLRM